MSKKELLQDDEGDHMVFYFPPVKKDQMPERDRCAPCRLLRRYVPRWLIVCRAQGDGARGQDGREGGEEV